MGDPNAAHPSCAGSRNWLRTGCVAAANLDRNPVADAGILGTNGGAAFAVALGMAAGLSAQGVGGQWVNTGLAFAGALLATLLVVALAMGRRRAQVSRLLLAGVALSAVLTATALVGPISFVGLMAAQLAQGLVAVGPSRAFSRHLTAALAAGGFLVVADVIGRIALRPGELPIGVVVSVVGAPVLLWAVRRVARR